MDDKVVPRAELPESLIFLKNFSILEAKGSASNQWVAGKWKRLAYELADPTNPEDWHDDQARPIVRQRRLYYDG